MNAGGWNEIPGDGVPDIGVLVWMWDGHEIEAGCRVAVDDEGNWRWAGSADAVWYAGGRWRYKYLDERNDYRPTHWMRLPEPPTGAEDDR